MQQVSSPRPIFKRRLTERERFAREAMVAAFGFRGLGDHPANQNLRGRIVINPFGSVAVAYAEAGLHPFPTGGDDGKRPLVKNWQRRR